MSLKKANKMRQRISVDSLYLPLSSLRRHIVRKQLQKAE